MLLALALVLATDTTVTRPVIVAPAETVSVSIHGTGRTVVFLPGLFGCAFGFRQVTPPLVAAGYRTVVIEPLGVGRSTRSRNADYSLAAQAVRVAAALDSLGIEDAILVPHSVSGGIAFRIAARRPDLVAGIVSLEGGPIEEGTTSGFRFFMRFARLIKLFGGEELIRNRVYASLHASSGNPDWVTSEVVEGYTADATRDLDATVDALQGMADAEEPYQLQPELAAIDNPVHLMLGGADHANGVPDGEIAMLQDVLTSFTVETVPEAGHFIFEEAPDAVVAAVQRLSAALGRPRAR